MKPFKKEKHIINRHTDAGWTFVVQWRSDQINITRSFPESKYPDATIAYRAAIACRDEIQYGLYSKTFISGSDMTVADVFEESMRIFSCRSATARKERSIVNKYLSNYINVPIQNIKPADVMKSMNDVLDMASDDTIKRILIVWHKIAQTAVLSNWILRDFTFGIKKPRSRLVSQKREMVTTKSTVEMICSALMEYGQNTAENRYAIQSIINAIWTIYYLGLRPAECLALTKSDVDLQAGMVSINKELGSSATDSICVRACKNETSVRRVPVPLELSKMLPAIIDHAKSDRLFTDASGAYISSSAISDRIRRIRAKHPDMPEFRLYQMRHQFSTDLVTAGTDLRTVQELMGHKAPDMTVLYARSDDSLKKRALDNRKESKLN